MSVIGYLRLHHVDPAGAQFSHTVVNVHDSFSLRHVQHDVNHNEAAGASRSSAEDKQQLLLLL